LDGKVVLESALGGVEGKVVLDKKVTKTRR
jgi:hypothetical protein